MGRRTGKRPTADDSFLWRICHALDESPRGLAKSCGLDYEHDVAPLLNGQKDMLADIDRDETWWAISEYVSRRLGDLFAVKADLNRALQKDRGKRILRQERFRRFHEETKSNS